MRKSQRLKGGLTRSLGALCFVMCYPFPIGEMNSSHVLDDWLRPLEGLLKAVGRAGPGIWGRRRFGCCFACPFWSFRETISLLRFNDESSNSFPEKDFRSGFRGFSQKLSHLNSGSRQSR